MESIELIAYNRATLNKKDQKKLRQSGHVPGVLYGGKKNIHFYMPISILQPLVYNSNVYFVDLNIEGTIYRSLLQDIQFHPVSELILHADFIQIFQDKKIKLEVPVLISGDSPGVAKGGLLLKKLRKIKIKAYPQDIPQKIVIDVSHLDLGKTIQINEVNPGKYTILNKPSESIAMVEIPRALRSRTNESAAETSKSK